MVDNRGADNTASNDNNTVMRFHRALPCTGIFYDNFNLQHRPVLQIEVIIEYSGAGERAMKSHYRVVVIGGGVVGASIIYHLAKMGPFWQDGR